MSWNKFPVQEDVADYASMAPTKAPQSASCARGQHCLAVKVCVVMGFVRQNLQQQFARAAEQAFSSIDSFVKSLQLRNGICHHSLCR